MRPALLHDVVHRAHLAGALTIGVAFGMAALFNGLLLPYSRIPLVMAEEGDMPRVLARLHSRHRTPWVAILLNCSLYALLHWLDFSSLILLSMWSSLAAYQVVNAALIKLRWKEPDLPRPFRFPFGTFGLVLVLFPVVTITLWAIWQSAVEYWNQGQIRVIWLGLAGFLSGPFIYGVRALVRRLRR